MRIGERGRDSHGREVLAKWEKGGEKKLFIFIGALRGWTVNGQNDNDRKFMSGFFTFTGFIVIAFPCQPSRALWCY